MNLPEPATCAPYDVTPLTSILFTALSDRANSRATSGAAQEFIIVGNSLFLGWIRLDRPSKLVLTKAEEFPKVTTRPLQDPSQNDLDFSFH